MISVDELSPTEQVKLLVQLADLKLEHELREFLRRYPSLRQQAAVEWLCTRVLGQLRVDLAQAEKTAAAARWLADEVGDDSSRGHSHRAAANVLLFDRDYKGALREYEAALEFFERRGDERAAAITRSSAVVSLISLGQYERAEEWVDSSRRVFEALEDPLRLARLELNMGNILARQDRFERALAHFRAAHTEFVRAGSPVDVGVALRNIAVCLQDLNDFSAALDAYSQARAYCEREHLPLIVLEIDYNTAYLYYLLGDYAGAIQLYEVVRMGCEAQADRHHQALCDLDLSEIYVELNLVQEAAWLARRSFEGFDRLGMKYEAAKALVTRALANSRLGEAAPALALLAEAREIFVREQNRVWPAMIDLYRSRVLLSEERYDEASRLAGEALVTFTEVALPSRIALCEILLARLDLAAEDAAGARVRSTSALEKLAPLEIPALEYQAWGLLGQAEEALGRRDAALAAYGRAHTTLERLRSHLETDELKISFLEDKLEVYESLVWLGLFGGAGADEVRTAFGYIEKAKSRSLADLMAFRAQAIPAKSTVENELVEQSRSLREELNWSYRQIDRKQSQTDERALGQVDLLREKCRRLEEQLLRTLRQIQATDPDFSSLQEATTVDLDTICSAIPEDAVLIEYFLARGNLFGGVLGRDQLEIVPLGDASRVRELHQLLQFQLSKMLLGKDYVKHFGELLQRSTESHLKGLHGQLIAPLEAHLQRRHLIVVPHDVLHYVPFHALFDGERYLIDRFSMSYAPSASVYYLCGAKRAATRRDALVLGVADERAPLIRQEVEAVADSLPGSRLLLGEEANEKNLRRFGGGARIIHLATHGFFRRDNPMFSAIQLGDSRLSLFDLYDLDLAADLVVLSGCGTGLAAVRGGDELVGLTRGLLYAGAQSVMVSLWDVNDESTAQLMRYFYRHLTDDPAPAQALRRAMRELRESHPHPYYWAPFVLIGGPDGRLAD